MEQVTRAAIYCRVSTKEQADFGYSIHEQEQKLIEYCNRQGIEIVKYYADRGISGKSIKGRPDLQLLLNDAKQKAFDIVLVWKINRISRKLSDLLQIVEILDRNSVSFKSITEDFDNSTPAGKMQFQMMGIIGEFERGSIAENVRMGMIARAKTGCFNGGQVLGYDSKVLGREGQKRPVKGLVVNESEAKLVRYIFQMYSEGKGYKAIANELNAQGYKTKKGNSFSINAVRAILLNPIYIGKIQYNRFTDWANKRRRGASENIVLVDGIHEPIIDITTWDKVQAIIKSNQRVQKKFDTFAPLTGILRCPQCGAAMVISRAPSKGEKIEYYSCGNWKSKGSSVCHANSIRVDKANEEVIRRLSVFLNDEKMIRAVVNKLNQDRVKKINPSKKELESIDKELVQLDNKKQRIFELYEDGTITKEEFIDRKEVLNKQVEEIKERKVELQGILNNSCGEEISYELVKTILSDFKELLNKCSDNAEKKVLIQMLVKQITIDQSRNIDSIQILLNDNLIKFLKASQEGVSDEKGTPSIFVQKIRWYKEVDINFTI